MLLINGRQAITQQSNAQLNTVSINLTGKYRTPITYPNIALSRDLRELADHVFYNQQAIATKHSYCRCSYGDDAGQHGGIKSGTVGGRAHFISASSNVFINGVPTVRNGESMTSNNGNTPPGKMCIL